MSKMDKAKDARTILLFGEEKFTNLENAIEMVNDMIRQFKLASQKNNRSTISPIHRKPVET